MSFNQHVEGLHRNGVIPMIDDDLGLYRDWWLKWHGWRQPVNQIVRMGFWTAHAPQEPAYPCAYRTTYGVTGIQENRFNVLDTTYRSGNQVGTEYDKTVALAWLVAAIDHGRFRPSMAALAGWGSAFVRY